MSKLPESIRVAGINFNVVPCEFLEHKNAFGRCIPGEHKIEIATNAPHQDMDTLIHEVLHCIYWQYNIKNEDDEERTVTTMATALVQVFKDNPDFVDWIRKEAKKP